MISSLFEGFLGRTPVKKPRPRQAVGLAVSAAVHALFLLGAVKARFEVKMLPVERRISTVYLAPRAEIELPADYEKHLADLRLLEPGGDAYWGEWARSSGRERGEAVRSATSEEPSTEAAQPSAGPEGSPGGFALSYRPGSEKSEVQDFDLRPSGRTAPASGIRPSRPAADPRLKSYPGSDLRREGAEGGHALARSTTGDRVIYRGRLPAGSQSAELSAWGREVVEAVQSRWIIPLTAEETKGGRTAVTVVVEKDGRASLVRIDNSSHVALLDRSVLSAITASLPFPPLPDDFSGRNLEAFFVFDCHAK